MATLEDTHGEPLPHALEAPPELLRVATAGSVDDGKSTLIGRLLHDTKSILEDQLEAVQRTSVERGDGRLDLALLTDGLRAEREQGITIDVAYRFFATARRSFILADTPGHVRYTRNMVTGASTADLALVLIDARQGVLEQSRRHAFIASLLRVPHVVAVVNKMDLVDFDEDTFLRIADDFRAFARRMGADDVDAIPVSALLGDNVVERSGAMDWYDGPPLLRYLEEVDVAADRHEHAHARLPVQYVVRPHDDAHHDYRGYAGRVAGGTLRVGEDVVVLPSGARSRVAGIDTFDGPLDEAGPAMSVTVRLADDLDVSRGQVIASPMAPPAVVRELVADVCWFDDRPLRTGGRYVLKAATRTHPRDGRRPPARDRRRHARARHLRDLAGAQRHRAAAPAHRGAGGAGPVRREPLDGRVHPHRRAHERDGGGRDGRRAGRAPSSRMPARGARTSCATSPPSRASSAGPRSAAAAGPCGSPACRRRASRRSPRPSRRCSSAAGAPPTSSTATRCATA